MKNKGVTSIGASPLASFFIGAAQYKWKGTSLVILPDGLRKIKPNCRARTGLEFTGPNG